MLSVDKNGNETFGVGSGWSAAQDEERQKFEKEKDFFIKKYSRS
jgi:hypothetical protein